MINGQFPNPRNKIINSISRFYLRWTCLWVAVGTESDVDQWMAIKSNFFNWPNNIWESYRCMVNDLQQRVAAACCPVKVNDSVDQWMAIKPQKFIKNSTNCQKWKALRYSSKEKWIIWWDMIFFASCVSFCKVSTSNNVNSWFLKNRKLAFFLKNISLDKASLI